jgi:hypothetical protein
MNVDEQWQQDLSTLHHLTAADERQGTQLQQQQRQLESCLLEVPSVESVAAWQGSWLSALQEQVLWKGPLGAGTAWIVSNRHVWVHDDGCVRSHQVMIHDSP